MDEVRKIQRLKLLGLAEVAELLGMSKAAVIRLRVPRQRRRDRVPFPRPAVELACGPVWCRAQIERYLDDRARGPAVTAAERARERREYERALDRILHELPFPGDSAPSRS
jgi:predicted DNA-binding transcriptional regulator AlpA